MEVPDISSYWSEPPPAGVLPQTERMLPPGAVISGFMLRFPGTPQELKLLMV